MRGAVLFTLILIFCTPGSSALPPIVPAITLSLDPPSVHVNASPSQTSSVEFHGNVTLDKLPFERITVGLMSSVNMGWATSCSPSSMVITDEMPHQFVCTAVIPENQQNATGSLTVVAQARGGGFMVTQNVTVLILVTGSPMGPFTPLNHTQNASGPNQTQSAGPAGPAAGKWSVDPMSLYIVAVVVVAAAAGSGAFLLYRRRKARRIQSSEARDERRGIQF